MQSTERKYEEVMQEAKHRVKSGIAGAGGMETGVDAKQAGGQAGQAAGQAAGQVTFPGL